MVRAQVLMKDISTEVPAAEVRELMEKCLKNAALVNYTRVSDHAKIEGTHARRRRHHQRRCLLQCAILCI